MSTYNLPVIAWGGRLGKTPPATSLGLRFDPIAAGVTGSIWRARSWAGQNTVPAVAVQP